MSNGLRDLPSLLRQLSPRLAEPTYVFCLVPASQQDAVLATSPRATFWEDEGLSVILEEAQAEALDLSYEASYRCITLQVHSSLLAVGLTAAVSTALGNAGISANMVAAVHHDHLFVPTDRASEALTILTQLSRAATPRSAS